MMPRLRIGEVALVADGPVAMDMLATLRPKGGVPMRFTPVRAEAVCAA
jgi:hypothetical protein